MSGAAGARRGRRAVIESLRNDKVKLLQRLARRRHRWREGLYVIEGPRLLEEALAAGAGLRAVFVAPALLPQRWRSLVSSLPAGVAVHEVTTQVFQAVAETEAPQGVLATVVMPRWSAADALRPAVGGAPLTVVADGVQDPGNVGNIIRAAAALGAGGLLLGRGTADPFNGKAVRAGAGAHFRLPVVAGLDPDEAVAAARQGGLTVVAAVPRGGAEPWCLDLTRPLALVVGGEGAGVGAGFLELADTAVSVPMPGGADSLNAAAACAVLLYEVLRQRLATSA